MTYQPLSREEENVCRQMILWISTVRKEARRNRIGMFGLDWVPTEADVMKSALFYRIRCGKDPLPEPPPTRYSYPWYDVVEQAGPHSVGLETAVIEYPGTWDADTGLPKHLLLCQSLYLIEARLGSQKYLVQDAIGTSYRFHVWYDPEHVDPHWVRPDGTTSRRGSWLMQNVEFAK